MRRYYILLLFVFTIAITSCAENASGSGAVKKDPLKEADQIDNSSSETYVVEEIAEEENELSSEKNDTSILNNATKSQEQAYKSAVSYLEHSAFSYSGLIEQLEYEGFSTEDATYAADNCGADWNDQAVKSAESYLKHSSFSKQELIKQLEYEGFSHEQSEYAAAQNGF